MKDEMGTHLSSLSCERLSNSIQNCFGFNSNRSYQAQTSKQTTASNSSLCNGNSLNGSTSTGYAGSMRQKAKPKNSCSGESCCCKGSAQDKDGFAYNICSQSAESQLNPTVSVTSSSSSLPRINQQSSSRSCDYKSTNHDNSGKSSENTNTIDCNGISDVDHTTKNTTVLTNSEGASVRTIIVSAGNKPKESTKLSSFTDNSNDNEQSNVFRKDSKKIAPSFQQKTLVINDVNDSVEIENNNSKSVRVEDDSEVSSQTSGSVVDIQHFRKLVSVETDRLNLSIDNWNGVLENRGSGCPVEVCGEIRTVIGQTRLIITERFVQFSKLVDQADGVHDPPGGRPVLLSDLQGFWDMIYFQVQDVDGKFASLAKLQSQRWIPDSAAAEKNTSRQSVTSTKPKGMRPAKKRPVKKRPPAQGKDEDKKRREAARKRLVEARKALAQRNQVDQDENATSVSTQILSPPNFVTDPSIDIQEENPSDNQVLRKRPESIVDVVSCAVAMGPISTDSPSLSSISSTSLVH